MQGGERMKVDDNEYNECGKFLNDEPDIPVSEQLILYQDLCFTFLHFNDFTGF